MTDSKNRFPGIVASTTEPIDTDSTDNDYADAQAWGRDHGTTDEQITEWAEPVNEYTECPSCGSTEPKAMHDVLGHDPLPNHWNR